MFLVSWNFKIGRVGFGFFHIPFGGIFRVHNNILGTQQVQPAMIHNGFMFTLLGYSDHHLTVATVAELVKAPYQ